MRAVTVCILHPSIWEAIAIGWRVPGQAGPRDDSVWKERNQHGESVLYAPPSLSTHFPSFLNESGSVFVFHLNVVRKSLV